MLLKPHEPPKGLLKQARAFLDMPVNLKITLRDLFWLTLVVAMGCVWWQERARNAQQKVEIVRLATWERQSLERLEHQSEREEALIDAIVDEGYNLAFETSPRGQRKTIVILRPSGF